MALDVGATHAIDPTEVNAAEAILDITDGEGAKIILEATGMPAVVWEDIERVIWEGKALNTTVVLVARTPERAPLNGEVFQVRRASVVGAQGHSGHGTFPRVIKCMATGMDVSPLITKKIKLEQVPENVELLQTDRSEVKITMLPD